jgi:hypothetical protein
MAKLDTLMYWANSDAPKNATHKANGFKINRTQNDAFFITDGILMLKKEHIKPNALKQITKTRDPLGIVQNSAYDQIIVDHCHFHTQDTLSYISHSWNKTLPYIWLNAHAMGKAHDVFVDPFKLAYINRILDGEVSICPQENIDKPIGIYCNGDLSGVVMPLHTKAYKEIITKQQTA